MTHVQPVTIPVEGRVTPRQRNVKSSRASWLSLSSHSVTGPKKTCWAT